jgi:hypothetical protein
MQRRESISEQLLYEAITRSQAATVASSYWRHA